MSFYNAIFGKNANSEKLLQFLGLSEDDFYRYRDCYLDEENLIAIYTRAGGGNSECYCGFYCKDNELTTEDADGELHHETCVVIVNDSLQKHPLFKERLDDDFDSTYCTYYFNVPSGVNIDDITPQMNRDDLWQVFINALKESK